MTVLLNSVTSSTQDWQKTNIQKHDTFQRQIHSKISLQMLSPIFTSSKQHVVAIASKLLNCKERFGSDNNTWAIQQPNNK